MTLGHALIQQAAACEELGSPFTGRVLRALPAALESGAELTDRLAAWPGDIGPSGASVPLRLAGALHALVLTGAAPYLADTYPPNHVDDRTLAAALARAISEQAAHIDAWINSAPQTNEVRRSAVLIAVGHGLASRYQLPLVLSELGASAGLNLMWDRYQLKVAGQSLGPAAPALTLEPKWTGDVPATSEPVVADRRGVDLNPISPTSKDGRLRLLSFLWADQADRIERTQAAIKVCTAQVDRADAADWLEGRLGALHQGRVHLIYHTIAWQYFPAAVQAHARALIEVAGARATADRPLAWFAMEADGQNEGAALTLRLWPGDETHDLGRADFHGRWVKWAPGNAFAHDK